MHLHDLLDFLAGGVYILTQCQSAWIQKLRPPKNVSHFHPRNNLHRTFTILSPQKGHSHVTRFTPNLHPGVCPTPHLSLIEGKTLSLEASLPCLDHRRPQEKNTPPAKMFRLSLS